MQVLTDHGYVAVEDLVIGDLLKSYDTYTGEVIYNTLLNLEYLSAEPDWTETGYQINGRILSTGESVWSWDVVNNLCHVVHANELNIGDVIFTDANTDEVITEYFPVNQPNWWKFTVSGDHSFIADNLELHNASRYWVGGGSSANVNATVNTNWGSASNTRDNSSVPGSGDAVIYDNAANGNTPCTWNTGLTWASLVMTGWANTLTHSASVTFTISGACTLASGMTYSAGSSTTSIIKCSGTFTSCGLSLAKVSTITSTTLTLGDALTCASFVAGGPSSTLTTNGYSITCQSIGSLATVNLGASVITLTGTGTIYNGASTQNSGTSTFIISDTSSTSKTFAGGGKTYNNLQVTGDNVIITGANTFNTLTNDSVNTNGLILPSATTTTVTLFKTNIITAKLSASTPASAATISQASGTCTVVGMSIKDSTASGGATFKCYNGTSVSGNTGWAFSNVQGSMLAFERNYRVKF